MSVDVDIVIVGAGAAGLGAARHLSGTGMNVHLIEASSRIGGRAWSHEINGRNLDLGCGWLHSAGRNAWMKFARECGVPLDQSRAAWGKQFHNLGFSESEQAAAWKAFEAWTRRLADSPPSTDCAADALDPGGEWNAHIRAIAGYISGARLEDLSAADYTAYDQASSEDNWRVSSGLGALVSRGLPRNVALTLSTPVDSLELTREGVTLVTRAGPLCARAVILTVSTSVLAGDTLKLPRELNPWRQAALQVPLGLNEKLFLDIEGDSPFEAETHVTGNPRDALTASYYIRPFGWPVIECFFGADRARLLCAEGPAAGFAFAIDQLANLFGSGIRTKLRPCVASLWSRMTRIGGGYSYALPGHAAARQALAQPFDGRMFFAGEATHSKDYSTIHGAHDTGVRAAAEALAALQAQVR